MLAIHGPNQRDIVGTLAKVRQQLRELHPTFPVPGELEWRRQHATALVRKFKLAEEVTTGWRPSQFLEHRFGVKQIDLALTAIHEQLNNRLSLRLEVCRPTLQTINPAMGGHRS